MKQYGDVVAYVRPSGETVNAIVLQSKMETHPSGDLECLLLVYADPAAALSTIHQVDKTSATAFSVKPLGEGRTSGWKEVSATKLLLSHAMLGSIPAELEPGADPKSIPLIMGTGPAYPVLETEGRSLREMLQQAFGFDISLSDVQVFEKLWDSVWLERRELATMRPASDGHLDNLNAAQPAAPPDAKATEPPAIV